MTAPSIILTRLDVQRLEQLIDRMDDKLPGVIALQAELDRADEVVGHDEVPAGVVTMNSSVHCREQSSGKDYHLTLVYPKDANADEGKFRSWPRWAVRCWACKSASISIGQPRAARPSSLSC